MEVPDLVLVTKGDVGVAARRAAADVRGALSLAAGSGPAPAAAIVSARTGDGIAEAVGLVAGIAGGAAPDARRRAQGRAWAESRLLESFGSVGLAALGPRLATLDSPFGTVATVSERAGELVHEALKKL